MSVYAQHGSRKSDKIQRAIEASLIHGVVFSPKDESPANLEALIRGLANDHHDIEYLIDPQFYISTVDSAREGHLPDYNFYRGNLNRRNFISPADIATYVHSTIDFQMNLPVTYLVSPTVIFDDFQDTWSQIALSLAQESIHYHSGFENAPPLLLSLVISEGAFRLTDRLEEFLDLVSLFEAAGFYLIIVRAASQYQVQIESESLQNILYFLYTLTELNDFEVITGYSDLIGILYHGVGINANACGWFNTLRQFSMSNIQPTDGGRAARPRYTSIPLLNRTLLIPELDSTFRAGFIDRVLTGTNFDAILRTNPANASWPNDIDTLNHWQGLNTAIREIETQTSISQKLEIVLGRIGRARVIYGELMRHGVQFESASGPNHLDQLQRGIEGFRRLTGI